MNIERVKTENKISEKIFLVNKKTAHFNYIVNFDEGNFILETFTYCRRTNSLNLLYKSENSDPISCLNETLSYLYDHELIKKENNPYVVHWRLKSDESGKENKSYYYVDSPDTARAKFLYKKDPKKYIIRTEIGPIS